MHRFEYRVQFVPPERVLVINTDKKIKTLYQTGKVARNYLFWRQLEA